MLPKGRAFRVESTWSHPLKAGVKSPWKIPVNEVVFVGYGGGCGGLFRGCFAFFEESIEQSVDELSGIAASISFGDIDRFVDGNAAGNRAEEHFVGCNPKDVAIDGRHPLERPVGGIFGKQQVDIFAMGADSLQKFGGKLYEGTIAQKPLTQELMRRVVIACWVKFFLEQDLQNNFPGSSSRGHGNLWAR